MGETRIGRSLAVAGEISGSDDLAIAGRVDGPIDNDAKTMVERRGVVRGAISARSIEIAGEVEGPLRAKERIEIREEGTVAGDIRAPRILIADGARFSGNVHMDRTQGDEDREEDQD